MKLRVLQLLIVLLIAGAIVNGQKKENVVLLTGTVYDQLGVTCPAAKVIATNEKGTQFTTTTGKDGSYEISLPVNLFKPGGDFSKGISNYSLKVFLSGFHVTEIKGLKLVPIKSRASRLDVVLEVGIVGDY